MERITAPIEIKEAKDDGTFTGYAAVFNNVDLGQDVILPGAFKNVKTTRDGMVRIALYHDLHRLAGKSKFMQDDHGLRVEGQLNLDVSYVKDAYALMKSGELDGLSVGFNILPDGAVWEERNGSYVRIISAAELWEYSPDLSVVGDYISVCAGIPPSSVDQLDLSDLNQLAWQICSFFTTPESSASSS